MGRILSVIVAIAYMLFAYFFLGFSLLVKIFGFLIVGLACIWFGDELGSLTGFNLMRMMDISEKTPGIIVRSVGWLIITVVPGIICAINLTK